MNRVLPPADDSSPRNNSAAGHRLRAMGRTLVVGAVVLALGVVAPIARADELDDRKKEVEAQIAQSKEDLHDYNQTAAKAASALQASQQQLATAEQNLVGAEQAEDRAAAKDEQAAAELVSAQEKLKAAKAEAAKAQAEVDAWMKTVGNTVVQTQQQRTDLLGLAVLTTNNDMASLNQRVQWSRTLMDSTQAKLDRLRSLQFAKDAAEQKATEAEAEVAAKREAAKVAYEEAQSAKAASKTARDQQAAAVAANAAAKKQADDQVAAEEKRQQDLKAESDLVSKRIADRIAAQKAAEERARAEAERKAAEAEAAAKKASAAKKAAAEEAARKARAAANAAKKPSSSSKRSAAFIYPSGAMITSPFGQRFHPVLRYWKLHDGTDFGAACGAPIRAAASGVVEEKYYNAGYGNRLIIDHGLVNGRYVTTSYNHATRYIVSVGQRVSQGQVVGYVGSTGYSTGCHLHFMAWSNGSLINPMTLY